MPTTHPAMTFRQRPVKILRRKKLPPVFLPHADPAATQVIDRLLQGFQLTQVQLGVQVLHCAPRSLTLWRAGKAPNASAVIRLRELDRLYQALAQLMPADEVGPWMKRTNEYLAPLTPLEVLARGEIDRLWHIIHNVGSGMPT